MSQENVELVLAILGDADVNLVPLVRDDAIWAASVEAGAGFVAPDFVCVGTVLGGETLYTGMDGFREFLLDWLAPWASYRSEVEKTIDAGEQVVTLYRIFGRHRGSIQEVNGRVAWVWTVCDGKIARITGHGDHDEALKAVGLLG